jgi:hypothetical protein
MSAWNNLNNSDSARKFAVEGVAAVVGVAVVSVAVAAVLL